MFRKWERSYVVDLESMSMKNPNRGKPVHINQWQIYTDGSKLDNANDNVCGASVVLFKEGNPWGNVERSFHLGSTPSVFQSELYALKSAARLIIDYKDDIGHSGVSIFVDNQASLLAINNVIIKAKSVKYTV